MVTDDLSYQQPHDQTVSDRKAPDPQTEKLCNAAGLSIGDTARSVPILRTSAARIEQRNHGVEVPILITNVEMYRKKKSVRQRDIDHGGQ
jgi:hypothetical protein